TNYFPADRYTPEKDDAVVVIDRNGRPLRAIKPDTKKNPTPAKSQLDAVTVYLSHIAAKEHIHARLLWLDPIAPLILLDEIKKKYTNVGTAPAPPDTAPAPHQYILNPIIGEYDDPAHQRQAALRLPLTAEGNTIIYGAAGSGKTTFLNAVIYSLLQDHTAADLNLYLLDFSAETLRAFAQAPQVGNVVFSHESEKVTNLLKMLQEEIYKRKALFTNYGGNYVSYKQVSPDVRPSVFDAEHTQTDLLNIVVVIHDFAVFIDLYEEKTRDLMTLTRECTKFGIFFILTALNVNTVRAVLRQNFKQLFALQLNDPADYHAVVGKTDNLFPAKHKGRGLVRLDDLYEFQIASITEDPIPSGTLQAYCQTLSQAHQGATAPRIPVMPETIDAHTLSDHIYPFPDPTQMTLPIGIDCDTLQIHQHSFARSSVNLVISPGNERYLFLNELAHFIFSCCGKPVIVIDPTGLIPHNDPLPFAYVTTPQNCASALHQLAALYTPETHAPLIIIITALATLQNLLPEEPRQDLFTLLTAGAPHNIILGEQAGEIGKTVQMPWCKQHTNMTRNYIWIGTGLKEQYALELLSRPTSEQSSLPPGHAFGVSDGQATRIKILGARKQEKRP
ncbi:MAG: FtsK/SpoIIIE domain-containing protein, partial [Peptococcaceae bacterium]|nr:FtsK/SpoIIIE domain-containing protein [Peptococcaceae bacterium]